MKAFVIVVAALLVLVALPLGVTYWLGGQTREKAEDRLARLERALRATNGERLVDGRVVRALEEGLRVDGRTGVALRRWTLRREGDMATPEVTAQRFAPFVLEAEEGPLVVAGRLETVVDPRIPWRRGGSHELFVRRGDRVSVLGEVSEREGRPGFYGRFTLSVVPGERWIEIQREGVEDLR